MKERLEEQFEARKEQLVRDIAALTTRKESALAQLTNIQALARQSAADFEAAHAVDDDPDEAWLGEKVREAMEAETPEPPNPDDETKVLPTGEESHDEPENPAETESPEASDNQD